MLSRYVIVVISLALAAPLFSAGCATQPPTSDNSAADEAANRARREAAEREAGRQRHEALQKLLAESPALSEQGLKYDVDSVRRLTESQQEALIDAGSRVVLTIDEEKELNSIASDQWYALVQLAAFYSWLLEHNTKEQPIVDRARAEAMQKLILESPMKQMETTWVQAGAIWWHQRCVRNRAVGIACY